jgi:hypothetical protein
MLLMNALSLASVHQVNRLKVGAAPIKARGTNAKAAQKLAHYAC